jgi:Flp pilus assembly protein TadG
MAKIASIENLRRRAREFRAANGANVTLTFALATIPMVGFVGAAVDYSRANSVKAAMQAAADSTALMLSKTANGLTQSEIQTKANEYFKALFNKPEANGLTITATYSTDGGGKQFLVNASSNVKTDFMGLLGFSTMKVGVDSQVKWGNTRLRVALVLDNTGSMNSDGKIDALKTATKNLLTQLKTAAITPGDVYVSIVPFVKDVNVGASNYNATWIDWTDWDGNGGSCYNNDKFNGSPNSYTSKSDCIANGKYWKSASPSHNTWNGCVTDRGNSNAPNAGNYDTNVSVPDVGNPATLFAAEQYSACPQPVLPLTYDWTALNNLVDSFVANGNTNQAIGLAHGWMSLVGGGPYPTPPAEETGYKYTKIIILLTDGLNTQNRWYTDQTSIDNRQKLTCDNVNTAGITLYTIQVNTGADPTSTLLQNCAGSPGKYPDASKFFLLTSASQMVTTFKEIGTKLSSLRISQ